MRKQEIILFLYRVTKCPTEAEKIHFERKMKVVNQKDNKNKRVILRSVVFPLC